MSCTVWLLTQPRLHCSSDIKMLFQHNAKQSREVRTQSVELTKLRKNSWENVYFSSSFHLIGQSSKRKPEKYQKLVYLARHPGEKVLHCSHLTNWTALSTAMNELLFPKLVKVQNSSSSHKLLGKSIWDLYPSTIFTSPPIIISRFNAHNA